MLVGFQTRKLRGEAQILVKPLVSILIPGYNAQQRIEETIASALARTWPHTETILIDDGSTDRKTERWHSSRTPSVLPGGHRALATFAPWRPVSAFDRHAFATFRQRCCISTSRGQIASRIEELACTLGCRVDPPSFSWKYRWIELLIGQRLAHRARIVLPRARWTVLRHWDKLAQLVEAHGVHSWLPGL